MHTLLIAPRFLNARLGDPDWRVIDCRADLADHDAGRRAYDSAHIPTARHAHLETELSGPRVPGVSGRHPLPERAALQASFARWGIEPRTQLIAYDAGPGMFAARLWWLARWLGHGRVAVLDGGLARWTAAGYPTSRDSPEDRPDRAGDRYPERSPLTRVAEAGELLVERPGRVLLDARSPDRFAGRNETIDPVAGHIAGARNAPFQDNLRADGRFRAAAPLRRRFDALLGSATEVVCYCGSGVTAAHDILALRLAGYEEPALYPGSWSEWIQDPSRPKGH